MEEKALAQNAFGIEKEALTTGEVARICNVAARTVSKWIDAGRLEGYRIPGSRDRRVHVTALEAFIAAHDIPVSRGALTTSASTRVLLVDRDRAATESVHEVLAGLGGFTVEDASDALSAAIACGACAPDAVVFDCSAGDPVAFVTALRTNPNFAATTFICTGPVRADAGAQFVRAGFVAYVNKPFSVRTLLECLPARAGSRREG
jgi:excisionase family DNA binding protein